MVAANVRDADRLEFAANYRTARQVLEQALRLSTVSWTGMVDDEPVCMFGVAPIGVMLSGHGRPWMVGTKLLDDPLVAVMFLRRNRPKIAEMLELYPVLSNYVAASNVKAIEWLRWIGFTVSDTPVPAGIRNVPFYHFTLRR
jgi:hypothetical protein